MGGGAFGCLKNLMPSRRSPRVSPRKPGSATLRASSMKASKGGTPRRSIKRGQSFKGYAKSHEVAGLYGASPRPSNKPTQIGK
jgi:hypothetical protein